MKSVIQIIRKSDEVVIDEQDVSKYSESRVKRLINIWENDITNGYYLKYVMDKTEHNGM